MDFDIVYIHQKFGQPYSYRNKGLAHDNIRVTSDPMDLTGRNK